MNLFSFALGSVVLAIKLYADFYEKEDLELTLTELKNDASLPRIKTYDFIIVGGGGAGCVVANRLSRFYKVLLLEAGGDPVPATQALVHYKEIIFNPQINFLFRAVPQTDSALGYGGILTEPTGRMLGGSTSHNGLIFNRGHPLDFDNWALLTNDSSWKYTNVLKYFKKLENYVGDYDNRRQRGQHGHSGPVTIDTARTPLLSSWLRAGSELGFKTGRDPNGPQMEGFVAESVSEKMGRRVSTYTAYIEHIEKKRKTLKIERFSTVDQVLINKEREAYGVLYTRHGLPQIAHASHQIIISAGTIGTPLLLMKSGIGPANVLREAGIPLVEDLPVGVGIHEHPAVSLPQFTTHPNASHLFVNLKKDLSEEALRKFQEDGKGPIVSSLEGQAFVVSERAKKEKQPRWPDLVLQLGQPLYYSDEYMDPANLQFYWLGVIIGRPKGSGVLSLNTTAYKRGYRNDEDLAILDPKLLTDPTDSDVLLEGIKLWLRILEKTKAFRRFGVEILNPNLRACSNFTFRSDKYWKCYIAQNSGISFHLTSGCRIGSGDTDKGAVLDSKMNVMGVKRLKVVDGSIMPHPPNANPTAAVVMIAEKASAEILSGLALAAKQSVDIPS